MGISYEDLRSTGNRIVLEKLESIVIEQNADNFIKRRQRFAREKYRGIESYISKSELDNNTQQRRANKCGRRKGTTNANDYSDRVSPRESRKSSCPSKYENIGEAARSKVLPKSRANSLILENKETKRFQRKIAGNSRHLLNLEQAFNDEIAKLKQQQSILKMNLQTKNQQKEIATQNSSTTWAEKLATTPTIRRNNKEVRVKHYSPEHKNGITADFALGPRTRTIAPQIVSTEDRGALGDHNSENRIVKGKEEASKYCESLKAAHLLTKDKEPIVNCCYYYGGGKCQETCRHCCQELGPTPRPDCNCCRKECCYNNYHDGCGNHQKLCANCPQLYFNSRNNETYARHGTDLNTEHFYCRKSDKTSPRPHSLTRETKFYKHRLQSEEKKHNHLERAKERNVATTQTGDNSKKRDKEKTRRQKKSKDRLTSKDVTKIVQLLDRYTDERNKDLKKRDFGESASNSRDQPSPSGTYKVQSSEEVYEITLEKQGHNSNAHDSCSRHYDAKPSHESQYTLETLHMLKKMKITEYKPIKPKAKNADRDKLQEHKTKEDMKKSETQEKIQKYNEYIKKYQNQNNEWIQTIPQDINRSYEEQRYAYDAAPDYRSRKFQKIYKRNEGLRSNYDAEEETSQENRTKHYRTYSHKPVGSRKEMLENKYRTQADFLDHHRQGDAWRTVEHYKNESDNKQISNNEYTGTRNKKIERGRQSRNDEELVDFNKNNVEAQSREQEINNDVAKYQYNEAKSSPMFTLYAQRPEVRSEDGVLSGKLENNRYYNKMKIGESDTNFRKQDRVKNPTQKCRPDEIDSDNWKAIHENLSNKSECTGSSAKHEQYSHNERKYQTSDKSFIDQIQKRRPDEIDSVNRIPMHANLNNKSECTETSPKHEQYSHNERKYEEPIKYHETSEKSFINQIQKRRADEIDSVNRSYKSENAKKEQHSRNERKYEEPIKSPIDSGKLKNSILLQRSEEGHQDCNFVKSKLDNKVINGEIDKYFKKPDRVKNPTEKCRSDEIDSDDRKAMHANLSNKSECVETSPKHEQYSHNERKYEEHIKYQISDISIIDRIQKRRPDEIDSDNRIQMHEHLSNKSECGRFSPQKDQHSHNERKYQEPIKYQTSDKLKLKNAILLKRSEEGHQDCNSVKSRNDEDNKVINGEIDKYLKKPDRVKNPTQKCRSDVIDSNDRKAIHANLSHKMEYGKSSPKLEQYSHNERKYNEYSHNERKHEEPNKYQTSDKSPINSGKLKNSISSDVPMKLEEDNISIRNSKSYEGFQLALDEEHEYQTDQKSSNTNSGKLKNSMPSDAPLKPEEDNISITNSKSYEEIQLALDEEHAYQTDRKTSKTTDYHHNNEVAEVKSFPFYGPKAEKHSRTVKSSPALQGKYTPKSNDAKMEFGVAKSSTTTLDALRGLRDFLASYQTSTLEDEELKELAQELLKQINHCKCTKTSEDKSSYPMTEKHTAETQYLNQEALPEATPSRDPSISNVKKEEIRATISEQIPEQNTNEILLHESGVSLRKVVNDNWSNYLDPLESPKVFHQQSDAPISQEYYLYKNPSADNPQVETIKSESQTYQECHENAYEMQPSSSSKENPQKEFDESTILESEYYRMPASPKKIEPISFRNSSDTAPIALKGILKPCLPSNCLVNDIGQMQALVTCEAEFHKDTADLTERQVEHNSIKRISATSRFVDQETITQANEENFNGAATKDDDNRTLMETTIQIPPSTYHNPEYSQSPIFDDHRPLRQLNVTSPSNILHDWLPAFTHCPCMLGTYLNMMDILHKGKGSKLFFTKRRSFN